MPSENFSLVVYKKVPIRKGEHWLFSRASHHLVLPLINFPFLAWLPRSLSFSLHSSYNLVPKPGRGDPLQLGGFLWQAHLWWSPPLDLAEKLRRATGCDSPLALLDWHPHTGPCYIHRLQGWVKSHPLGFSLSRLISKSPRAHSCVPHLTLQ